MGRVKRGVNSKSRHKKILKLAKGYFGAKSKLFRPANEQVMRSMAFSYEHRKNKKSDFRKIWIQRINAAARIHGISYNKFINGLKNLKIIINRKVLSDLAINDNVAFYELVNVVKNNLK